jgi:hypothetical protein
MVLRSLVLLLTTLLIRVAELFAKSMGSLDQVAMFISHPNQTVSQLELAEKIKEIRILVQATTVQRELTSKFS